MASTFKARLTPDSIALAGGVARPTRLGSWELVRLIGEGQWASVYQARPAGSPAGQPAGFAVKLLRPEWQDDTRGVALLCASGTSAARSLAPTWCRCYRPS